MHTSNNSNSRQVRVALVARFNHNWAAGRYYVENLIMALSRIPGVDITVLHDGTQQPHFAHSQLNSIKLTFRSLEPEYTLFERLINGLSRAFTGRMWIEKRIKSGEFEAVLPVGRTGEYPFTLCETPIFWIPDFQELHYPDNFTAAEREQRKVEREKIAQSGSKLMLSSQSALDDFQAHFQGFRCRPFVIPFRVYPDVEELNESVVLERYELNPRTYLLCSNQFWKHKNHKVLVRAMLYLKETQRHEGIRLILTGMEMGFANDGEAIAIKQMVSDEGLNDQISFLGYIPRKDQIALLKNSAALVQPSLFEGWNTSIEDALSMGVPVLASDIPVHCEQLGNDARLVPPDDVKAWAKAMRNAQGMAPAPVEYSTLQKAFERKLYDLITQ